MSTEKINYLAKAFDVTKSNIILAQPLVLFLVITTFTLTGLAKQTSQVSYIFFYLLNILLFTAFLSGWFYMIKKAVVNSNKEFKNDKEKSIASLNLGKEFFNGVGECFLTVTYTTLAYILFTILLVLFAYKFGLHYLPNPKIDLNAFMQAVNSTPVEMQKYLYGLSFEQIKAINIWVIYGFLITFLYSFVTMFWYPALFDKKDVLLYAPFKALNRNICFLFKNFLGSLWIIFAIFVLNFILSIFSLIFNLNLIFSIIGLVVSFYFMTYVIVVIFLYYEEQK